MASSREGTLSVLGKDEMIDQSAEVIAAGSAHGLYQHWVGLCSIVSVVDEVDVSHLSLHLRLSGIQEAPSNEREHHLCTSCPLLDLLLLSC
jgi:hypothetical protein